MDITIKIIPVEANGPKGKLADAELLFGADCGMLAGLRLIGFGVWERRGGGRNVTFPARTYRINGEQRSFALLRPRLDGDSHDAVRDAIIAAYAAHEAAQAAPTTEVNTITEYGLTQRLAQPVRMF